MSAVGRLARVALPAALVGGVVWWWRGLRWQGRPDAELSVPTEDGWLLGVARYLPRQRRFPLPVLLGHGSAGSALIFDLGTVSLARWLADEGFDVYAVDLRGRRRSWPPSGPSRKLQWCFDDFALRDLPAAVAAACETSGSEAALWVGLEVSGQALYAAAIEGVADRVRAAVTLGAPAVTPPDAQVPGVTAPPRLRVGGRVPTRWASAVAGPLLAYARSAQLASSFRMAHTDPLPVARYFRNGVPDEAALLADQFARWIEDGVMVSLDGSRRWSEQLGAVRLPVLLLVGAADLQRPPQAVEATAQALGGPTRFVRAGTADGFSVDYGHDDLIVGRPAPSEVFPLIRDWLAAHC